LSDKTLIGGQVISDPFGIPQWPGRQVLEPVGCVMCSAMVQQFLGSRFVDLVSWTGILVLAALVVGFVRSRTRRRPVNSDAVS